MHFTPELTELAGQFCKKWNLHHEGNRLAGQFCQTNGKRSISWQATFRFFAVENFNVYC